MARRRRSGGTCSAGAGHHPAADGDGALAQPFDAGQAAQQRRLARAGRPQQDQERPRLDVEVYVRQGRLGPENFRCADNVDALSPRRPPGSTELGLSQPNATPPCGASPSGRAGGSPRGPVRSPEAPHPAPPPSWPCRCRSGSCSASCRWPPRPVPGRVGTSSWEMGSSKKVLVKGHQPGQYQHPGHDRHVGRAPGRPGPGRRAPGPASINEPCTWATWPIMIRDCVGTEVAR